MWTQVVSWVLVAVGLYLSAGALFAAAFVLRGVKSVDPAAREGSWGFRALVFPGCVALWPLLARRWAAGATHPPPERNAHRDAARGPAARAGESAR